MTKKSKPKPEETEVVMLRHQGHNIKYERNKQKMKQDTLAKGLTKRLGEPWTQKRISMLETQSEIDDNILKSVAEILDVDVDDLKSREPEEGVSIFGNTFEGESSAVAYAQYYKCTFNPIDEIKRLNDELMKEKNERLALMEKMLNK